MNLDHSQLSECWFIGFTSHVCNCFSPITSWLPKYSSHPLFNSLLACLSQDVITFFWTILGPSHCPSCFHAHPLPSFYPFSTQQQRVSEQVNKIKPLAQPKSFSVPFCTSDKIRTVCRNQQSRVPVPWTPAGFPSLVSCHVPTTTPSSYPQKHRYFSLEDLHSDTPVPLI